MSEKGEDSERSTITDEMVESLFRPEALDQKIKAADENRKRISKIEWHKLRARCKRDLFFLCYGVLGYTRLSVNLHGGLCQDVKSTEDDRFRLYLLPRNHFKSTILTIGHSIQTVLPYNDEDAKYDEDRSPLPWPSIIGPDARLLIAHETHESASRYLFSITQHFTSNPVLMGLFPEIVPNIRKQRVNKWELELPREKIWNEPTIDTLGVGGKSQGRHYNLIALDDIYGDKARDSEAESSTTKDWFDNIQAFFSTFLKDKLLINGTRYSFDDVYAHAMERYGPSLHVYTRRVEEVNPETKKLEPIFPEEVTSDSLAILKKNKRVFSAQYQNDPKEGDAGFDEKWKHYYYWLNPQQIAVFSGAAKTTINVRDLDICLLIDPGVEKSGGLAVTGMDHLSRVFLLVGLLLDMKPPDFVDLIFKLVPKWQPRVVAIESDVFANTYQYWLASEMVKRGIRFQIQPVFTKKRAKNLRIGGLSTYFSSSQFYANEAQSEFWHEYDVWGRSKDIHLLDAIAYGPEVWRPGMAPDRLREIQEGRSGQSDNRDIHTGYSAIEYGE